MLIYVVLMKNEVILKVNNPFSQLKNHFKVSFSESILEFSSQTQRAYFKNKQAFWKWHTAISRKVVGKMHATIPKGTVSGFEFTVVQRNLKEWHKRPRTYVCECQRKATKKIRQLQCQEQRLDHIPYYLSGLSRAHLPDNLSRNSCMLVNPDGSLSNQVSFSQEQLGKVISFVLLKL